MRNFLTGLFAFLVVICSSSVYADPIVFHNTNYGLEASYGSANAACQASAGLYGYQLSGISVAYADNWYCNRLDSQGNSVAFARAYKSGSECANGAPYDSSNGSCGPGEDDKPDGQKCEDQQGQPVGNPMVWSKKLGKCVKMSESDLDTTCAYFGGRGDTDYQVQGTLDTGGNAVAPPKFAGQMGCEVQTITTSDCTLNVKGAITCNVTARFTGKVAGQSAGPDPRDKACDDAGCQKLDPKVEMNDKPCVMSGGFCNSETETSKEGKQSCGSVNGAYTCITSKPTSNGVKTDTTVKTETQTDGTVKTVKTDTSTKTSCTDVKTCTTKTSTTTTTTTTGKTGQTTSTNTTCTGSCGADGKGVGGSGGGSGSGSGGGEEDDGGSASASDDCTVPPKCDGDAYLCSILRQEYLDSCAERALPSDKQKAELKALIDKQQTEITANQKTMDDKVTSLVNEFQSASSGGASGGQCFKDKTFSVRGASFTLPFSLACGVLEWFRYAVLAIAYLISLRIVTKEL